MSHYSQQTFFRWNCERGHTEDKCCQMLLYRNHRLSRDRSPVRPPRPSHSSWALIEDKCAFQSTQIPSWTDCVCAFTLQFSSVEDGICVLRKAHIHSVSPETTFSQHASVGEQLHQATVSPSSGWTPGFLAEDCKQTSRHQRLSGQQSAEEKGCLICVSAVCVRWPVSMSGSSGATSMLLIS